MTTFAVCLVLLTIPGREFPVQCLPPDTAIYLTWYYPELGGINCDHDCGVLADNKPWSREDYDRVAACPMAWHYATVSTPYGTWHCRDTGGGIRFENHPWYGPVARVDVLRPGAFQGQYDAILVPAGTWDVN